MSWLGTCVGSLEERHYTGLIFKLCALERIPQTLFLYLSFAVFTARRLLGNEEMTKTNKPKKTQQG